MLPWLARLQELEEDILYNQPPVNGEVSIRHRAGTLPLLISAPHAAAHTRTGIHKDEDEYTAAFALLTGELTGAHVLYTRRKLSFDPNFDEHCAYKETLAQLVEKHRIAFVIDLHGARPTHPFGIALGTMKGESCPRHQEQIINSLESAGFQQNSDGLNRLAVNIPNFTARRHHTITRFCATALHIPAIQVELNAHLRIVERRLAFSSQKEPFRGEPQLIQNAIAAIFDMIRNISP